MTEQPWTSIRYAVVDVEGNGRQPPDLVEAAVVPIADGAIGAARTWLIKPPRPITAIARRFHKISDADVADAPPVAAVEQEIRAALDGTVIVAHNAHIDVRVLRRELAGWEPLDVIDTLKLAKRRLPGRDSYKLGALVEACKLAENLPEHLRPHRAEYDALVTARLFIHLATRTGPAPMAVWELLDRPASNDQPDRSDPDEAETLF